MVRRGRQAATTPPGLVRLADRPRLAQYVRAVWERRAFMHSLASAQLSARHLDTLLGNVWQVINPLLLIGTYYVIFGILFRRSDDALAAAGVSYIAFLAVGIFVFGFMQRCWTSGAAAIGGNLGLIRTLQFPRAVLPLASVTKEVLSFGAPLLVMLGVVVATGVRPAWSWLAFPLVFAGMTLFGAGGALVLARLAAAVPDVKNLLPFGFRLALYLSGVLFDAERLFNRNPQLDWLPEALLFNPLYVYVTLARTSLLGLPGPEGPWLLLSAGCWTFGLVVAGVLYVTAGEKAYGRG